MKTKYNDFWLTKNNRAANAYMDEVAKESNFTGHHKGYTILPHKIHRCYGLSPYEKFAEKETLDSYAQFLMTAFAKRFPPDVNGQ